MNNPKPDDNPFGKGPELDTLVDGHGQSAAGGVHEVIFSKVIPGHHNEYRDWSFRMREAKQKFPGYRGTLLQPPEEPDGFWTTIIQFENQQAMDAWMSSTERKNMLEEAKKFIEIDHVSKVKGSFPGWVPNDPDTGNPPPNWKAALLVLLGLYPIVVAQIEFVSPIFHQWGFRTWLSTFLANCIGVAGTSFITMPIFVKLFYWWLFPKRNHRRTDLVGVAMLTLLFAVELIVFASLIP